MASITLDDLKSQLTDAKNKILAYPDQSLVGDLLKRDDVLSNLVTQLKNGLPATTNDQINAVKSGVQNLVSDVDKLISGNRNDNKA